MQPLKSFARKVMWQWLASVGVGMVGHSVKEMPVYAVSTLPMRRISRLMFASEIFA